MFRSFEHVLEKKIFGMPRQALHESPNTALQYDSLQNIFFLNNTAVPTCSIFHCGGDGGVVAVVLIGGFYYALLVLKSRSLCL